MRGWGRAAFWTVFLGSVGACLFVGFGCAAEGVGKPAAIQATGIAAVTTGAVATIASGGLAIVVGFVTGLMRLILATSTTTAPPGAPAAVVHSMGLLSWVGLGALVWCAFKLLWPRYRKQFLAALGSLLTLRLPTAAKSAAKAAGMLHTRPGESKSC